MLSEKLKVANAARVNLGKTGPKGEEGIKEDLAQLLGRDLDPEEVEHEMQRKKGYIGIARKRKEGKKLQPSSSHIIDEGSEEEKGVEDGWDEEVDVEPEGHRQQLVEKTQVYSATYVAGMAEELERLRSELRATKTTSQVEAIEDGGPSTSVAGGIRMSEVRNRIQKMNTMSKEERLNLFGVKRCTCKLYFEGCEWEVGIVKVNLEDRAEIVLILCLVYVCCILCLVICIMNCICNLKNVLHDIVLRNDVDMMS